MSSFIPHVAVNPSAEYTTATMQGSALNNQALQLERDGDLPGAESAHLEAIRIKESGLGANSVGVALSRNALGELYIKMGKLDEAEDNLKKAIQIRTAAGSVHAFDAAVSRENLAQLYEIKGKLKEAKEVRLSGAPNSISCGNYNCPGQTFALTELSQCTRCKSTYYCSRPCQAQDWKSRHKKYCKTG